MAPNRTQTRSGSMSQLGQTRTSGCAIGKSALPPSTDMRRLLRHVRFVPTGDIAPFHSINSSARSCISREIVRPSAFAVLKLITSSYLVGACTGRLPGFSPFRMRSTYDAAPRCGSTVSKPHHERRWGARFFSSLAWARTRNIMAS